MLHKQTQWSIKKDTSSIAVGTVYTKAARTDMKSLNPRGVRRQNSDCQDEVAEKKESRAAHISSPMYLESTCTAQ